MAPRNPTLPVPPPGEHPPGERRVSSERPESWTIEWDGHDGLAFEAYASWLRAPYLQNVTTDGATILWRVNPKVDTAALMRPLDRLTPGAPFALHVEEAGYLGYTEREVGINLGWSTQPWVQWEVRGDADALARGKAVALWNRAASDYLVHSRRRRGIDLGWLADSRKRNPIEWRLEGSLPGTRLENLRKGGRAHLVARQRRYGVNLGWGARPNTPNLALGGLQLEATVLVAPQGTPVEQGRRLTTADGGIGVSEVSWSYLYRPGVGPGVDASPDLPNLRLCSLEHRPVLQCETRITGLRPGRVYHYRVACAGRDPRSPAGEMPEGTLLLADNVTFRTSPGPDRTVSVRWLAMGDLGPGKWKPSYVYDVCDLFCEVARRHDAQLWLPLGDLDNDTNGHPNAVDPFFFDVYNAHRGPASGRTTSSQASGPPRQASPPLPTHATMACWAGCPPSPPLATTTSACKTAARRRGSAGPTWAASSCPAPRTVGARRLGTSTPPDGATSTPSGGGG